MNDSSSISSSRRRFGGGRPPTGTPSLVWSSLVVVVSLLAGASIVHNIYKPDLTLPPVDPTTGGAAAGAAEIKQGEPK